MSRGSGSTTAQLGHDARPAEGLAQIEDPAYLCFDVLNDPAEKVNLSTAACAALIAEADRTFGMLPKDMRRLRDRPDFGRAGERGGGAR